MTLFENHIITITVGDVMNIEQANTLPMSVILEKLNCKPTKTTKQYEWYLSPLRNERTASFQLTKQKNTWKDYGTGKGGDVVNLVCEYLLATNESNTVADALRWIKNMIGTNLVPNPIPVTWKDLLEDERTLEIISVGKVKHFGLKNYLVSRRIDLAVGFKYLNQVRVLNKNTMKKIIALGLKNEEKGYELRNAIFKNCYGKKAITFIRGSETQSNGINLFEGMFDFLSVASVSKDKTLKNDTIVLNSTSMVHSAFPYLQGYGYKVVYSWMDNDDAGNHATDAIDKFCQSHEQKLIHKPMQYLYAKYDDVNECHKALALNFTK